MTFDTRDNPEMRTGCTVSGANDPLPFVLVVKTCQLVKCAPVTPPRNSRWFLRDLKRNRKP